MNKELLKRIEELATQIEMSTASTREKASMLMMCYRLGVQVNRLQQLPAWDQSDGVGGCPKCDSPDFLSCPCGPEAFNE